MTLRARVPLAFGASLAAVLLACSPDTVPPRPTDAAADRADAVGDAAADAPLDGATPDGPAPDAAPDAMRDGPCGDGGVCGGGQRCDAARMRCVDCLATAHCGGATPVCASGRCVAATPCNSSRMCPGQVCDLSQSRCVDCVTDAECEMGQRCTDGVCATPATCRSSRDCSAAGLVCNVAQMRCVECLEDRDCAMGSACTAGNVCRIAACTPNARRCASTTRVAVCDARGVTETETDCATGEVCTGGECRRLLCAPGSASCESATARRTCNADGMAYTVAACASGESCVAGECRAPGCTPGAATCTSTTERRVCNADGMTFTAMACPTGQMCSGGACAAAPTCPTGQTLCGAACVDTQRDTNHCGGCGRACSAGMVCGGGTCSASVDTPAPMLTGRSGFALVVLADGRVLAAGGESNSAGTRTAEIYDPTTNRWQVAAPMLSTFSIGYGVRLSDGRVAVSGLVTDTGASRGIVDVYTPTTNTWARLTDAGSVGNGGFVVTHEAEGYLYAIARDESIAYRYNLATRTWSTLARFPRFPERRFSFSATAILDARGLVLVFGDASATPTTYGIYSPASNTWTVGPELSWWRHYASCVLGPDGRIYISGGVPMSGGEENAMRVFDPVTNSLTPLAPMRTGRRRDRMVLLPGGQILVAGGATPTAAGTVDLNTVEIYTVATNTWR